MPAALLAPRMMRKQFRLLELQEQSDTALFDQGGRPLGPRAQHTRVRILDATVELLGEKPMRDLRVIDIARKIGSSPATFYQYFKDVEDVVLHLASRVSEFTPEMVEMIRGDWSGRAGHERGRRLAEVVIEHWDRYAPILRVRNNASDEGDASFRELRMSAMMPLVYAFSEVIEKSQQAAAEWAAAQGSSPSETCGDGEAWEGGRLYPVLGGAALASVLERLSMYHLSIAELGGTREQLIETMATLIQGMLTSKR